MASSASVKRTGSQTTPSTPSKLQLIKSHVCDFPGCGKTFTRAEHLRRHALNHQQDDNSCERCGVHFTRPDLLGRFYKYNQSHFVAGLPTYSGDRSTHDASREKRRRSWRSRIGGAGDAQTHSSSTRWDDCDQTNEEAGQSGRGSGRCCLSDER